MLTEFQFKVLKAIYENEGIRAARLSELVWPESKAHDRVYKNGPNAAVAGKGAWVAMAGHIGRLSKKGWIRDHYRGMWENRALDRGGYELTSAGKEALLTHALEMIDHLC